MRVLHSDRSVLQDARVNVGARIANLCPYHLAATPLYRDNEQVLFKTVLGYQHTWKVLSAYPLLP